MKTWTLGFAMFLMFPTTVGRAAESPRSQGWLGADRVVALGEATVILDKHGEIWSRVQDGIWRQARSLQGDWADIAAIGGDRLLLLSISAGVFEATLDSAPKRLFNAPAGAYSLAVSGGFAWMAGRASHEEPVVFWRRRLADGEVARVELTVPVTPFEEAALERGLPIERELFNRLLLVPAGGTGVRAVFLFRDLVADCQPRGCRSTAWRSPRTDVLARKPPGRGMRHPPLKSVAGAATNETGELFVLPTFTDWDPSTGAFDQRDEVIRLGADGQVAERCPLPGTAAGLVARGKKVWALLDTGRLTPVCG